MSEKKVLKYRSPSVPRQGGEVARLRVLKGAEVGSTFILKSSSVIFGRGDDAEVVMGDLKASRSHARLEYTKEGWIMSDLGSANGIFFQGEYIRKFALTSAEHFTIGETMFEFLAGSEATKQLAAPLRSALDLDRQDQALSYQKIKVQNLSQPVKAAANPLAKKSNPRTLLLLAALAGGYFYLDDAPAQKTAAKAKKPAATASTEERSLASYMPAGVSKEVEKTAEQYYWQGFREYMKGNYLRAKDSFELSLQVNPGHQKARHYLASAEKENQDEIKRLIEAAKKAKLVGRTSDAKGNCETALRHLYNDRANPDYADCDEILKEIKAGGDQ